MAWVLKFAVFSFLLISLSATPVTEKHARRYMIVWNVGQGQWVTSVESFTCRHFDVGGERFPWKKISKLCREKKNLIYLSHWDWDHIGALSRWPSSWETCIALPPRGTSSKSKMKMLAKFSRCSEKIDLPYWQGLTLFTKSKKPDTNAGSQVLSYRDFLFPGDSPVKAEKLWQNLAWVSRTRVLILGHHGSRTSTSEELLYHLPTLQMSIASSRWERYKHPHPEVVSRMKRTRIPLLRTEDWGNIWMEPLN